MPLVRRINAPKSVFVSDGKDNILDVAIPIRGGISVAEQDFVDKLSKQKGWGTLNALIREIAEKIAPLNGGDPVKVATALLKYQSGNRYPDPLEDYRGYFLLNTENEFKQFLDAVNGGKLDKWEYAACAHALFNRVPNFEEVHGGKWKTEQALDPDVIPPSILVQLYNLYHLELLGSPIDKYVNDRNEFTWKADGVPAEVTEAKEETIEELAGKS